MQREHTQLGVKASRQAALAQHHGITTQAHLILTKPEIVERLAVKLVPVQAKATMTHVPTYIHALQTPCNACQQL
jgi:hypothetical protein